MKQYDVIIIGGGAAGFFAALNCAEMNPKLRIAILERGKTVLNKVKVSGGGRCNVTHAEFIHSELINHYPRGKKELLGPFHQFAPGDTIEWFEKRHVSLKIEEDGRMFPVSNSSQTIIDCFLLEAKKYEVDILKQHTLKKMSSESHGWCLTTNQGEFYSKKVIIATGSNTKIWELLKQSGHSIVPPVPSLFTFNINDRRIKDIPGVVVKHVAIKVLGTHLESNGPLLITHWGMSAPAILKLSAFGALELARLNYKFQIGINFVSLNFDECIKVLKDIKMSNSKKLVFNTSILDLPKRLWQQLVLASSITQDDKWADINKFKLEQLTNQLTSSVFQVDGKSTFKEEFVTAGGVDLKEINFKTFESKLHKNLYFAGEILNVDAVTGGFNFQNAWTGAFIAAKHITYE